MQRIKENASFPGNGARNSCSILMAVEKDLLLAMAPEVLDGDGDALGNPKRKVVMKTAASIPLSYETKV